jgi:hypothetical protein
MVVFVFLCCAVLTRFRNLLGEEVKVLTRTVLPLMMMMIIEI